MDSFVSVFVFSGLSVFAGMSVFSGLSVVSDVKVLTFTGSSSSFYESSIVEKSVLSAPSKYEGVLRLLSGLIESTYDFVTDSVDCFEIVLDGLGLNFVFNNFADFKDSI
jgi:hypothetical protein